MNSVKWPGCQRRTNWKGNTDRLHQSWSVSRRRGYSNLTGYPIRISRKFIISWSGQAGKRGLDDEARGCKRRCRGTGAWDGWVPIETAEWVGCDYGESAVSVR